MIGRVRGTLVELRQDGVVVDVAGIGYEVAMTARGLEGLPPLGEEIVVHTHLYVREDQQALFGFTSADERQLFRILISVNGVGPKVALAILGTLTEDELRVAVVTDDVAALTMVPGIGKRSAQKIMLELQPRLDLPDAGQPGGRGPMAEVRSALETLGYRDDEIRMAMSALPSDLPVEELLRTSLRKLGGEA
jgi:holliday junction DNA helicase RuvA